MAYPERGVSRVVRKGGLARIIHDSATFVEAHGVSREGGRWPRRIGLLVPGAQAQMAIVSGSVRVVGTPPARCAWPGASARWVLRREAAEIAGQVDPDVLRRMRAREV